MTLRLVLGVVVVTIISMALQTPLTWISAYMVFFATKENRVITTLTGIGLFLGATIGIAMSLFFYRYTFDYPELRIPVMAATVFAGMFFSRVFAIGPLAFAIGFVLAVTQSMAETVRNTDELVRGLLWLWVIIVGGNRAEHRGTRTRLALVVGDCRFPGRDHSHHQSDAVANRSETDCLREAKEKFVCPGRFHKSQLRPIRAESRARRDELLHYVHGARLAGDSHGVHHMLFYCARKHQSNHPQSTLAIRRMCDRRFVGFPRDHVSRATHGEHRFAGVPDRSRRGAGWMGRGGQRADFLRRPANRARFFHVHLPGLRARYPFRDDPKPSRRNLSRHSGHLCRVP